MGIERSEHRDRGPLAVGLVLIAVGVAFLAGQVLEIDVGHYGWPMFVIVPGLAVLVSALLLEGPAGVGFAIFGSITTMTGLVLLYQNATNHWESWAYAWALVAPGSVGVGMLLEGLVHGDRGLVDAGLTTGTVGLALFLVFGLLFEDVIGIGGNAPLALRDVILPGGVILLGVAIVAVGLLSSSRGRREPGA